MKTPIPYFDWSRAGFLCVTALTTLGACSRHVSVLSTRDGALDTRSGVEGDTDTGARGTDGVVTTGGAPVSGADGSLDVAGTGGAAPPGTGGTGTGGSPGGGGSAPSDGSARGGSGGDTADGATGSGGGSLTADGPAGRGTGGVGDGTGGISSAYGGAGGSGGFSGVGLRLLAGVRGGPGTADGLGQTSRFNGPWSIASDGAGNLFVADTYNHTIRKVALATGAVSTVAGLPGVSGYADGTGSVARFYNPDGLAWDGANLYISDEFNRTIRKLVIATGAVTTLAGSPGVGPAADGIGTAAHFAYPAGLALDGAGNLFVADSGFHTIREINVTTAEVTTVAGSSENYGRLDGTGTAARFAGPAGLAFDGAGTLYVADVANCAIRKIDVATGKVSTLAGSLGAPGASDGTGGAARFAAPYGIVNDGAGNLLVTDYVNATLRKVVIASAEVTTIAGSAEVRGSGDGTGSDARFYTPVGAALDGGNLFISDYNSHTVRKLVLATGVVTTLAGAAPVTGTRDGDGAAARFSLPIGMAVDGAGNLFVADSGNHAIRRIAAGSNTVTTLAGSPGTAGSTDGTGTTALFDAPYGLTSDGGGNLFVADTSNDTLRSIATASGSVSTLAGSPGIPAWSDGVGKLAGLSGPIGLARGTSGILVVGDTNNHEIRQVVIASATVTTLAGTPPIPNGPTSAGSSDGVGSAARFNRPMGIALDGAGNAYVADQINHTIRKVVIASGTVTTIAGSPGQIGAVDGTGSSARFNYPVGLAYDGKGNLFVADWKNHSVRKLALATSTVTTYVGSPTAAVSEGPLPAGLNAPWGLAVGPDGELFITDENAVLVVR